MGLGGMGKKDKAAKKQKEEEPEEEPESEAESEEVSPPARACRHGPVHQHAGTGSLRARGSGPGLAGIAATAPRVPRTRPCPRPALPAARPAVRSAR